MGLQTAGDKMEMTEEQGDKAAGVAPLSPELSPGLSPALSPNVPPLLPPMSLEEAVKKQGAYCRYPRRRPWLPVELQAKAAAAARKAAWQAGAGARAAAQAGRNQRKAELAARRRRIQEGNAAMADALSRASAKVAPQYSHAERTEENRRFEKEMHQKRRKGQDRHGYNGLRQVGNKIVPVPGEKSDLRQHNRMHDSLEFMFACRQINAAEKSAGEWFRDVLYLSSDAAGPRSPQFGMQAIQTSVTPGPPVRASMLRARRELKLVEKWLGQDGYALLVGLLLSNKSIPILAREAYGARAQQSKTAKKNLEWYLGERFRECLRSLIKYLSAHRKTASEIIGWQAPGARPANRPDMREQG